MTTVVDMRYVPQDRLSPSVSLVAKTTVHSVEDVQQLYESWNTPFHAGDYGIFKLDFPIPLPKDLPDWVALPYWLGGSYTPIEFSQAGISSFVTSYAKAKGVELWADSDWSGKVLNVYFVTGLAPLVILAIIVGILALAGILTFGVSLYKIQKVKVDAQETIVLDRQEKALDVISQIEDPAVQAEALEAFLKATSPADTGLAPKSMAEELGFQTPLAILAVFLGIAVLLFVFMKGS